MGILKCACKAEAEGKTFEDADVKIDHGISLSSSGPACSGHPTRMTWDEKGEYDKTGKLVVYDPQRVASQGIVMLVGKEAKNDDDPKQVELLNKTIVSLKEKLIRAEDDLKKPCQHMSEESEQKPKKTKNT